MKATRNSDPKTLIPNRARGYGISGANHENREPVTASAAFSQGALISSVLDMVKWDAGLNSEVLLKKQILEQMWAPVRLNDGTMHNYGFSWYSRNFTDEELADHRQKCLRPIAPAIVESRRSAIKLRRTSRAAKRLGKGAPRRSIRLNQKLLKQKQRDRVRAQRASERPQKRGLATHEQTSEGVSGSLVTGAELAGNYQDSAHVVRPGERMISWRVGENKTVQIDRAFLKGTWSLRLVHILEWHKLLGIKQTTESRKRFNAECRVPFHKALKWATKSAKQTTARTNSV